MFSRMTHKHAGAYQLLIRGDMHIGMLLSKNGRSLLIPRIDDNYSFSTPSSCLVLRLMTCNTQRLMIAIVVVALVVVSMMHKHSSNDLALSVAPLAQWGFSKLANCYHSPSVVITSRCCRFSPVVGLFGICFFMVLATSISGNIWTSRPGTLLHWH
jgi:uncharacterized membrane protein YfbV (UPF0208 family)